MMEFDDAKDELLARADTALKYAQSLETDAEFEVFISYENAAQASISQGIVTAKDGSLAGNAVRVALGKRIGFACGSGVDSERVKRSVREALEIVRAVDEEDSRFVSFCDSRKPGKESNFSQAILELQIDDLISDAESLVREASNLDERIGSVSGNASRVWGSYAVANTRGVMAATRYGYCDCSASAQAVDGDERRGGADFDVGVDRTYLTEGIGKSASEEALSLLGAKKLDLTEKMTTIWTYIPAATYILASLARSVSGDSIVEKTSPLCDMMGDMIGPSGLSITDNGQSPTGLGTNAIDGEGFPQSTTPIVENGVLKSFLFDQYYGKASGTESTGNSDRTGGPFRDSTPYETTPSVSAKWLEISPGSKSEEEVISEIDGRAVLIKNFPLGIFHTEVATGEFSVVANSAYLVENGEVRHSIEPVSISGNFYEGLRNLVTIASNVRALPWNIASPTLVFDGFSVTS
jgi:PmbA protein